MMKNKKLFSDVRYKKWLGFIIIISVLLRVAVSFYFGDVVTDLPGTFDQISYDMLAKQVLDGHGFTVAELWWPMTPAGAPTAHWSFLYTLYLAAVYGVVGYHPLVARIVQAMIVGVLMPYLSFKLANRYFNAKVGLVAAAIVAGYIYFFYYAATLMTEMFYITAILWGIDIAEQIADTFKKQQTPKRLWLFLGLALGIAVLLRQLFLLIIPFLSLWIIWRAYQEKPHLAWRAFWGLAASGVIVLAMVLPWTVRNYQVFHRFVLLNTNAGYAFFWGNHPIHGNNFISILPYDGPSYQDLVPEELRHLDEAALDQALLKRAMQIIADDPVRYLRLSLSRTKDYFKFWYSPESGMLSNISRIFSFGIMLPFMTIGLIRTFWNTDKTRFILLYLFMGVYTGIHLLSWALIRYRLPVDAILIIFAAPVLMTFLQWIYLRMPFFHSGKSNENVF